MSIWQFHAAVNGYVAANSPEDDSKSLSNEEIEEIGNWLDGR